MGRDRELSVPLAVGGAVLMLWTSKWGQALTVNPKAVWPVTGAALGVLFGSPQVVYLPAGQSTIHVLSCVHFPNASEGRIQGSEGMGRH